jgi:hypothetical protein
MELISTRKVKICGKKRKRNNNNYIERNKKGKGRGLLIMVLFFSPFFHITNFRV